jgi:hypothetical protein
MMLRTTRANVRARYQGAYFPTTRPYTKKRRSLPTSDITTQPLVKRRRIQGLVQQISTSGKIIDPIAMYQSVYYLKSQPELPISRINRIQSLNLLQVVSTQRKRGLIVDIEDYIRPQCPTDKFVSHDVSVEKLQRNFEFVELLKKVSAPSTRSQFPVVLLDAPSITTTNFLISSKLFEPNQIHVPNLNAKFTELAPKSFQNKGQFYHCSMYEWLRDFAISKMRDFTASYGQDLSASSSQAISNSTGSMQVPHQQYHFGGDYCCTFGGNKYIKPQADLALLFSKSLFPRKNGVMWLTFSTRRKHNNTQELIRTIVDFVQNIGAFYGYRMRWINYTEYTYSSMVYFYFISE